MLITVDQALGPDEVGRLRALLAGAGEAWVAGRATAGHQGAAVKANQQIDEASTLAAECQAIVLQALERHPLFISAALPNLVYPPMFNRYCEGMSFGAHVDGGVRIDPRTGRKLRTDVSATLFLTDTGDYDGGELEIFDTYGAHGVRLEAGDLVLYPATSLHQVTPVTRGERLACVFWVQSLVRDDARRALLFEMDGAIQQLNLTGADADARRTLVGCYHNLLRQWAEV
ncbi:MAG: 2OG-Fe(II) oxygenase [Phenylobacterium sp.]|nr:2OG-Fe(II) oxygenase [Phenylobacterium sp.]